MSKDEKRLDRRWGVVGVMCAAIAVGCAAEPRTTDPQTGRSSALTPGRVDPIRVQAILASYNDGSFQPTVTPAQIRADLDLASQIFAPASIKFEFDPETDVLTTNSTLLARECTLAPGAVLGTTTEPSCDYASHNDERNRVAQTYPGKLVVYFSASERTSANKAGIWSYGPKTFNWSNGTDSFVTMMGGGTCAYGPCEGLAHEMGHYLHLAHTMGFTPDTVAAAQNAIKDYVESQGHTKAEAYQLFDGDGLASTPPDPGPDLFVAAGKGPCNVADGSLDLMVTFSDSPTPYTYTFTPDRENVMDYWDKWCRGGSPDISIDQVLGVRSAIDAGNRAHLTDTRQFYSAVFEPGSTSQARAIGWGASDFVTRFDQEINTNGRHLTHMQAYDGGGGMLWDGVWDTGSRGTTRAFSLTLSDFATRFNQEIAAGKHAVHMQAYDIGGGQIRYDGIWEDGNLGTTRAIGWASSDFVTRFNQEISAGKHLVHMQAYDIGGGQIRYDGVWETGNNGTVFAVGSAFNDFVTMNKQQTDAGKKLVHFQPYDTGAGLLLYDGVWETSSTAQTHIFAEGLSQFAAQFDAQNNASGGRHAVQMRAVRAGQRLTTTNLFLHNGSTGATQMWVMRGATRMDYADLDGYLNLPDSTGWRFIGARDFNQDGKTDILIHNVSSGAFQIWYMNGASRTGYADFDSYLNLPDSTGWQVVGIADLDHDGKVDIVIHNGVSGGTQVWYMNGGSRTAYADLDSSLNRTDSGGWRPVGTGDSDHDGNVDLLWHNAVSGANEIWHMNGATRLSVANVDSRLNLPDSTGWTIISTADVSLDGQPDIIIHNGSSGATQVWSMYEKSRVDYANFDSYLDLPDSTGWLFVNSR